MPWVASQFHPAPSPTYSLPPSTISWFLTDGGRAVGPAEGRAPRSVNQRRAATLVAVTTDAPAAPGHWARGISQVPSSTCVREGAVVPPVLYSAVTFLAVGSARRMTRSMRAVPPALAGTFRFFVAL